MRYLTRLVELLAAFCLGVLALAIGAYFYLNSDSWGASRWRSDLSNQLQSQGGARVADLISFRWSKIYFVMSYGWSGDPKMSEDLWGRADAARAEAPWWENDERYWTVAIKRSAGAPFIIKMDRGEWDVGGKKFYSAGPNAMIVLIDLKHERLAGCRPNARFCIALEDQPEK